LLYYSFFDLLNPLIGGVPMIVRSRTLLAVFVVSAAILGCGGSPEKEQSQGSAPPGSGTANEESSIQANLKKLGDEDRKQAEEQKFCAVLHENRLGSMGVPMKVVIQDQPVFLCCDGCETKARAHADRTLAKVKELREMTMQSPED
jgi:hypothetical protein